MQYMVWRSPPRQPRSKFSSRIRIDWRGLSWWSRGLFVVSGFFAWPLPARDRFLRRSRQGQLIGRGVAGQCRAGTQGGAFAHGDRRHQLRVRTHEYIVFDDGAEFIDAVVIAGNRARADIDALADGRVANVREMVGLGCAAQRAFLDLDKIAHMRARPDVGPRTQARIRPDTRFVGNDGILYMSVGIDVGAPAHRRIPRSEEHTSELQ